MTSPDLTNLEGRRDFAVHWAWSDGPPAPGITAVLRVKDEARSLPHVLPPLLRAVDRVLVVDNGSTDGTPDLALAVAAEQDAAARLDLRSYPFPVARCGPEHLHTPPHSVHSLTYFYNWSFAQVHTAYSLKWDGDMVLTEEGVAALRALAWQLEAVEAAVVIPRHPVYVVNDSTALFDLEYVNEEPWLFPNRPAYSFVKAFDWELRMLSPAARWLVLPQGLCFELKYLDSDEFDHWSATDFDGKARTARKKREWDVFSAIADGQQPAGLVRVAAPSGAGVIEHLREQWIAARPRPIVRPQQVDDTAGV